MNEWVVGKKPKEYGYYIVTFKDKYGELGVDIAYYGKHPFEDQRRKAKWFKSSFFGHRDFFSEIVAWRDLPEPYKERYFMAEELHIDCHICQKEMPYVALSDGLYGASFAYTTSKGIKRRTYLCPDCMKKVAKYVEEEQQKIIKE